MILYTMYQDDSAVCLHRSMNELACSGKMYQYVFRRVILDGDLVSEISGLRMLCRDWFVADGHNVRYSPVVQGVRAARSSNTRSEAWK